MEQQPFFSVVMPIYGVEPYLRKAIQSVLDQTFQDFEIILVNDCSPDNSAAICEEFCERYDNIHAFYHESNRGLSAARNTGFSQVHGKYVWFMDSDDYVEADLFEKVYESLKKSPAEVVVFGCVEDYYDKNGQQTKSVVMSPREAYCRTPQEVRSHILELETGTFYGYAWNKFYSTEHIRRHQLSYENVVLIEDIKFNVAFFDDVTAMNVLAITPYHYAKRGTTSLTAKFVPEYYAVHRERVRLLYEQQTRWETINSDAKSVLATIFVRYIFSALSRNCDPRAHMNHTDRKAFLRQVFEDTLFEDLIDDARPQGASLKLMTTVLKKRYTCGGLFLGRLIYLVQTNLQQLFVLAKQVRK